MKILALTVIVAISLFSFAPLSNAQFQQSDDDNCPGESTRGWIVICGQGGKGILKFMREMTPEERAREDLRYALRDVMNAFGELRSSIQKSIERVHRIETGETVDGVNHDQFVAAIKRVHPEFNRFVALIQGFSLQRSLPSENRARGEAERFAAEAIASLEMMSAFSEVPDRINVVYGDLDLLRPISANISETRKHLLKLKLISRKHDYPAD